MPAKKKRKKIDAELVRQRLKLKNMEIKNSFIEKYPEAYKFLVENKIDPEKFREHSAKILSAGALAGSLVLTPPSGITKLPPPLDVISEAKKEGNVREISGLSKLLLDNLNEVLPDNPRPLTPNEEKYIEKIIENLVGIKTDASLEGEHLNTSYGYIGAEQHLRRFPGDNISQHDEETQKSGIAPGLGAWGYFTKSKENLTQDVIEREKWYAVVQTLYLPDWNTRQPYLRDWYKYRKVLIVNTNNGRAVVADIADSGPAAWTGKHFGGSPEVMNYLGGIRYKKGPVIVFFVDDPENKIPLGPVDYNKIDIPSGMLVNV